MLCAWHWAGECCLNAWTIANGLIAVTQCVLHVGMLCGLCWLMGDGLSMGQTSKNVYSNAVWAVEWWAEAP